MRGARLVLAVVMLSACVSAAPATEPSTTPALLPTPIVIYVTPAAQPTPMIVYVTAEPVVQPTPIVIYVTPPPPVQPVTHDMSVVMTLTDSQDGVEENADGTCSGKVVYGDLVPGMQFTVRSASSEVVGFGTFATSALGPLPKQCIFTGEARGVPDLPLYTVDIGNHGAVNFTRDDLVRQNWRVELNIDA